jgi:hypothetical protein
MDANWTAPTEADALTFAAANAERFGIPPGSIIEAVVVVAPDGAEVLRMDMRLPVEAAGRAYIGLGYVVNIKHRPA